MYSSESAPRSHVVVGNFRAASISKKLPPEKPLTGVVLQPVRAQFDR